MKMTIEIYDTLLMEVRHADDGSGTIFLRAVILGAPGRSLNMSESVAGRMSAFPSIS